ncbi:MAG: hypothetical protein GX418_00560 [Clostridiales bacterium]|nr:hypothetical protein [Clostridiales bacterium]
MRRLTRRLPGETGYRVDAPDGVLRGDGWYGPAVDRLAAYENLQETLSERVRAIPGELAALRAQGREKSVAFRERMAQMLLYQQWLALARDAGAEEETPPARS